jgi:hypothetical protein
MSAPCPLRPAGGTCVGKPYSTLRPPTGRVQGDLGAPPTYRATIRSQDTRPDHVLVRPLCIPHVTQSCVLRDLWGSDHFPIVTRLSLPIAPRVVPPCQGEPLSRIVWDTRRKRLYVRALATSSTPSFEAYSEAVERGDVGVAFREPHRGVTEAAAQPPSSCWDAYQTCVSPKQTFCSPARTFL